MKRIFLTIASSLFLIACSTAQTVTRLDKSKISFTDLDAKIQELMGAGNVQGMAISIFNNNAPVYEKTFGYKNLATKEPIKLSTNIYGASLSKSMFAVLVMKLVEEGVLDLDKPLESYLPQKMYSYPPTKKWHDNYEDLKGDTMYTKITARMCLDHTTGFPNWRFMSEDRKLKITGIPGKRFSYSGEGLVYLQVVLERMLGKPLEQLMQEKIFTPLGITMSSYQWQAKFEADYCLGHKSNGETYEKDKDNDARAASTLETTLSDFTIFLKAVLTNKLITPGSRNKMFSPQVRLRSIQQFGPLSRRDSTLNDNIQLSYGLGWVLLQSPHGVGAFKEGHGDGFQHYMILFPKTGTGVLIMTNSDNGEGIFKELLKLTIGDTYSPWYWDNYIPYDQVGK